MPRALSVLIIAVLLVVAPVLAQSPSADEKELAAYTLTTATLNKVVAVMRSMAREAAQDPKAQQMSKIESQIDAIDAQIEKLEAKEEMTAADEKRVESLNEQREKLDTEKETLEETMTNDTPMNSNPKTLTEMEQNIRKVPMFAGALQREGLAPREFSKFMLAMMQAAMIEGFSQGKVDYAKLPAGVNAANIRFITEHKAELAAMQKEFDTSAKQSKR